MKRKMATFSTACSLALALSGTAVAVPPEPQPGRPSCHGLAMAHGSMGVGAGNFAKAHGITTVDAHYVFMEVRGCE